jgi:streptogramin lyase
LGGSLAVCLGLLSASLAAWPGGVDVASAFQINEFPTPTEISRPNGVAAGPDGNVWFTEEWPEARKVGRITPEGQIAEFPLPWGAAAPNSITSGSDGNLWFTDGLGIGRVTPSGQITQLPLPGGGGRQTFGIAAGADGNLWFSEVYPSAIGRVTPKGEFAEFQLPEGSGHPRRVAAGPDGNMWFTLSEPSEIGRIALDGKITLFPLPNEASEPIGIAGGSDNNVWFTERWSNKIGRIGSLGNVTEFPLPSNGGPEEITAGPDGNLWFTLAGSGKLGRITPGGAVTEYAISTENSVPRDIVTGPDGRIWFAEWLAGKIGRLALGIKVPLSVSKAGTGSGFVFSQPSGIKCGETCSAEFEEGAGLTLFAEPAPGSKFVGWKGCDSTNGSKCNATMSKARTVTAQFDLKAPSKMLTVIKDGTGSGTVFSEPGGLKCGEACSAEFEEATGLALYAEPAPGSKFSGWSGGGCSGTETVCKLTMDEAKKVTATFDLLPKLKLSVIKEGSGSGTVTSSPEGINCGKACEVEFTEGYELALYAEPAPGSKFSGWSGGGCSGAETACKITMDEAREVVATFESIPQFKLTIAKVGTGSGTVVSEPEGIDCGEACEAKYEEGEAVQLAAIPSNGSKFVGWKGCYSASGTVCKVTTSEASTVTAQFDLKAPSKTLSVTKGGSGSGIVISEPFGIKCTEVCSAEFEEGELVQLSAIPFKGSKFVGWSGGGCSGIETVCKLTMDEAKKVTATFDLLPKLKLSVTKEGSGSGTVTSSPEGINCGKVCEAEFYEGTGFALFAKPDFGSKFVGWSGGGCSSAETTCKITMDTAKEVVAIFEPIPQLNLSVVRIGTGSGTVVSETSGIDCGEACEAKFYEDAGLVLFAKPAPGSKFVGWKGCDNADGTTCKVTMSKARTVTAQFDLKAPSRTLSVTKAGAGTGTVYSEPGGIKCGEACSAEFEEGETVLLSTSNSEGSKFVGWSGGGCSGAEAVCKITMDEAKKVVATFDLLPKLKLSVVRTGTGTGFVSSEPEGINCGEACSAEFTEGTGLALFAKPFSGSKFVGWKGCDNTGGTTCKVTMSKARTVTAQFALKTPSKTLTVTKEGAGSGTVYSAPSGIKCGEVCTAEFEEGETVQLSASVSEGSKFLSWSGGCSGTEKVCKVTMDEAESVTATFAPLPPPGFGLSVFKEGTGSGIVISEPEGIDCGETCEAEYEEGAEVVLSAFPEPGSRFVGWSGGGCSDTDSCEITMNEAQEVVATFDLVPQLTLTVTKEGTGSGTVTSSPEGIDCGKVCSAEYEEGETVLLSASPSKGSEFSGWSGGGCSGTESVCKVAMSEARSVTATFEPLPPPGFSLSASREGTGSGVLVSQPEGINCGGACSASFEVGSTVILKASPVAGSSFSAWKGCDVANGRECRVTMNAAKAIKAKFVTVKALSIGKEGAGAGSIKSSPSGINCLTDCASAVAEFATGKAVTLTATPYKDSIFVEWGGDCAGSGSCVVTMSAARAVTAKFAPIAKKALTVNKAGSGTGAVKSTPAAINCASACATQVATFSEGVHVVLTATPAKGMAFTEWTGACTGSGPCEVTMSEAATVGAVFAVVVPPKPTTTFALTLSKASGTGSGQVTTAPAGVNCDDSCSTTTAAFKSGAQVILKASPATGSTFTEWSGDCTGSGVCEVTMSEAREVAAKFDAIPKRALTVEKAGGGTGSVKSKPAGIDCGTACPSAVALYTEPAQVVLTATPGKGSEIVGWIGCDVVNAENQCIVTMNQYKTTVAIFD